MGKSKYPCNEVISKEGCINALAKSLAVVDPLKSLTKYLNFGVGTTKISEKLKI